MGVNLSIFNSKWVVLRSISFLAFLGIMVFWIGEGFEYIAQKNHSVTQAVSRFNEFYQQEKDSIDMVFIGSSHAYCTFDPEIFDQALGTNSFQLGTPLQHADSSYFSLKEVLRYQKPKVVVFELYWDMLDDTFDLKQAEIFLEALESESPNIEAYYEEVFPLSEKVKYFIKAVRYQPDFLAYVDQKLETWINQYRVVVEEETEPIEGTEYYRSKGYIYADYVIPRSEMEEDNQFNDFDGENWQFDATQKKFVEKFIELAKENDIQVVLVTAPIANVSMEKIEHYDVIHKAISDLAKAHNLPYIDYNKVNQEENLLVNENFRDDAHLNHSGVEIVDAHFITWLKEQGIFE